eukprot:gene8982-10536_t
METQTPIPKICKKCSLEIGQGEMIQALDSDWHTQCFQCVECSKPIKGYFLKDGKPYCKEDYQTKFMDPCTKCQLAITGSKLTDNLGKHYHPECFSCSTCSKHIDGNYIVRDNAIHCTPCNDAHKELVKKQTTRDLGPCFHCKEACLTQDAPVIVVSPTERYHKKCFRCVKCKNSIEGEFYTLNDLKSRNAEEVMKKCFECTNDQKPAKLLDPCTQCQQATKGELADNLVKHFHPVCFSVWDEMRGHS